MTLGIIGAGKAGTSIARTAIAAGFDVMLSSSGSAERIALTIEILVPGARAATTAEVVAAADPIILAISTHRFRSLDRDLFAGKVLIDAMNYWYPTDGDDPELAAAPEGSSVVVQRWFASAHVVKSFNQLGYHDIEVAARPAGAPDRVAIAVAGDDRDAVDAVVTMIDTLGFDAVDLGSLAAGASLQPGGPGFGVAVSAAELRAELGSAGA